MCREIPGGNGSFPSRPGIGLSPFGLAKIQDSGIIYIVYYVMKRRNLMLRKNLENLLREKHLKRTKARILILNVLEKGLPKTASEIFAAVLRRDKQLSLSTVYRNCEILAEQGLLSRSNSMTDGLTRYEFARGTEQNHAVCLSCRRIFPVDIELEKNYKDALSDRYGFRADTSRIEIYGYCKDCIRTGKDKQNGA